MKTFNLLFFAIFCLNLTACKEQIAQIGQPAPDIAAYDLNGKQQTLATFKGKPLLVSFWSETCGVCVKELNELEQKIREKQSPLQLLAVNIDPEQMDTHATVVKHQIKQKVVKDQLKITAERYRVIGTPTTFLIDEQGMLQKKFEGQISATELDSLL